MVRDPTYSNFQLVHGRRDDENVQGNCCNHQRRNEARRGWKGDITCGGWTILCGKACILYFVIATIFLIFLILLVASLVNISAVRKHIRGEATDQNLLRNDASQAIMTRMNDMLTKLTEKDKEILSLTQNVNKTLTELSMKQDQMLADMSKKLDDIMHQIMIKMREVAEIECRKLQCPTNWTAFDKSCYFFSIKEATWHNGQQFCSLHGGNLFVINNANEQKFISVSAKFDVYWFGLIEKGTGNWEWVDGTAFNTSATDWNEGEPNNSGGREDCAQIWGKWNDANCDQKRHFVCEQKRNLV